MLSAEGLNQETTSESILVRWSAVAAIRVTNDYIFFPLPSRSNHPVLPMSFSKYRGLLCIRGESEETLMMLPTQPLIFRDERDAAASPTRIIWELRGRITRSLGGLKVTFCLANELCELLGVKEHAPSVEYGPCLGWCR